MTEDSVREGLANRRHADGPGMLYHNRIGSLEESPFQLFTRQSFSGGGPTSDFRPPPSGVG